MVRQMTWRPGREGLLARVREVSRRSGRSMNEYVTMVLDAATDPDLETDDARRVRERLIAAGLVDPSFERPRTRMPDEAELAEARRAAGTGTPLSDLISDGRR